MIKVCSRCKVPKDIELFSKNVKSKDGLQSQCMSCRASYTRAHYYRNKEKRNNHTVTFRRARKDKYNNYLEKLNLKCKNCDEKHVACLDFHHRNPLEKTGLVSHLKWSGCSFETLKKEIEKCDVLCANCHRKLHWEERNC